MQAGKVLTDRMLLHTVWGGAYEQDVPILRVFVTHLRCKIEADPAYILTEPSIGYCFTLVCEAAGVQTENLPPEN